MRHLLLILLLGWSCAAETSQDPLDNEVAAEVAKAMQTQKDEAEAVKGVLRAQTATVKQLLDRMSPATKAEELKGILTQIAKLVLLVNRFDAAAKAAKWDEAKVEKTLSLINPYDAISKKRVVQDRLMALEAGAATPPAPPTATPATATAAGP